MEIFSVTKKRVQEQINEQQQQQRKQPQQQPQRKQPQHQQFKFCRGPPIDNYDGSVGK